MVNNDQKTMTCPQCGSQMVHRPPKVFYCLNPPQWDDEVWCGCGYSESRGRVTAMTEEEALRAAWECANAPDRGSALPAL